MATRLVIDGGVRLTGEVRVSAAKNAALPAMAASLLTAEPVILENVPGLADVVTMRKLLETLGAETSMEPEGPARFTVARLASNEAPYELVSTMRASVVVLGPLLARSGVARVALPGGCAIGVRPIDQHLKGLAKLGADISIQNGYVEARASRLKGARITTDLVTGHRHREPHDGGRARGGRDGPGERGPGAGGRRPGAAPHRHGRPHRGSGHRAHRDRREWLSSGAPGTASSPTGSRRVACSRRPPSRTET
jgi:hypothetical protein